MWCVRELDVQYIERMEALLWLYGQPYDAAYPVVCFDEKSVQLVSDLYAPERARPGKIARRDHEYIRRGTANVFCAIEPKAGRRLLKVTERRTAKDFAEALRDIEAHYKDARVIHLVLDNLNTHCKKSLVTRFGPDEGSRLWNRFRFHFTPKHASWLNQAEIEISLLSRAFLRRTRHPSIASLRHAAKAYQKRANKIAKPFDWRFSVRDARRTFEYAI